MSSTRHEQHRTFMQHHLDRAMDDDSDATTMNPPPIATTPHPPSSITTKPPSAPTTTENSTERHCERSARIANQVNRSRRFGTNRYDVKKSDDDNSVDVMQELGYDNPHSRYYKQEHLTNRKRFRSFDSFRAGSRGNFEGKIP